MSGGSHARPSGSDAPERGRLPRLRRPSRSLRLRGGTAWRLGTPLAVIACGVLFVASATNSDGTDLRPGRYTDLASLVKDEADQYAELQERVADLDSEVDGLTSSVSDKDVARFHRRIRTLEDPAGLVARQGPGVRITLSDAPEDLINSTTDNINRLLVHQQDLQAVVNALWKGGATAVTIQGQRVVSTTGIKCWGNAVQLQGVPYPQPYVIEAVGDQGDLAAAVDDDSYVSAYREDAADPDISVGWDFELESSVDAPAFDGLTTMTYATVLRDRDS